MTEPIDAYVDQVQGAANPFGVVITFLRSPDKAPAQGVQPQPTTVVTVRMSHEHMKVMVFMFRKQVLEHERQVGLATAVAGSVLNSLGIGPEVWKKFWET